MLVSWVGRRSRSQLGHTLAIVCAGALWSGSGGCRCGQSVTETPDASNTGERELIAVGEIRFEDSSEDRLFKALRGHLETKAAGMHHLPLARARGGNFIRECWCSALPANGSCCAARLTDETPQGTRYYRLTTLHYRNRLPEVFGVGFSAGEVEDGLRGSVSFSLGGKSITGSSFQVKIFDGNGRASFGFSDVYRRKIAFTELTVHAPGLPTEDENADADAVKAELGRLLESPDSFRDTALARYKSLSDEVEQAFASHKIEKRTCGEPPGDGTPPPCWGVPLTPAEEQEESGRFRKTHDAEVEMITTRYGEYHAFLVRLLPPEILTQ